MIAARVALLNAELNASSDLVVVASQLRQDSATWSAAVEERDEKVKH